MCVYIYIYVAHSCRTSEEKLEDNNNNTNNNDTNKHNNTMNNTNIYNNDNNRSSNYNGRWSAKVPAGPGSSGGGAREGLISLVGLWL